MTKLAKYEKELLIEMLHLYSPSGEESRAAEYLVDQINIAYVNAYIDEIGNAVSAGDGVNIPFAYSVTSTPSAVDLM